MLISSFCLPLGKVDYTSSPSLSRAFSWRLRLRPWCLGFGASSTFAQLRLNENFLSQYAYYVKTRRKIRILKKWAHNKRGQPHKLTSFFLLVGLNGIEPSISWPPEWSINKMKSIGCHELKGLNLMDHNKLYKIVKVKSTTGAP